MANADQGSKKLKSSSQKKRTKMKTTSKKTKKKTEKVTAPKKRGRPRKLDKLKNNSKRGRPKKPKPSFPGTEPDTPPPTLPIETGI